MQQDRPSVARGPATTMWSAAPITSEPAFAALTQAPDGSQSVVMRPVYPRLLRRYARIGALLPAPGPPGSRNELPAYPGMMFTAPASIAARNGIMWYLMVT